MRWPRIHRREPVFTDQEWKLISDAAIARARESGAQASYTNGRCTLDDVRRAKADRIQRDAFMMLHAAAPDATAPYHHFHRQANRMAVVFIRLTDANPTTRQAS